ncbi:ribonuclease H-like domain, reverse transcriptase, RNA-dependent DNA polymerase, partial [Tanacetum coccineum]
MTRSSNKDLIQPFENPERVFRSSRKLSKTQSLDYLNSLEFYLISDLEDQFEEEETKSMAETMEEYIGSDHEDANEHIEKVLEIVNLFHIPNITQDQRMLRAFPMSLTRVVSRWLRNKPTGSITTWEGVKKKFLNKFKELLMKCPQHYLTDMHEVILLYNGLEVPTRQIFDSKGAIPTKTVAEYSQKWHNETSRTRNMETYDGLDAIQAQLNNLGREIKKVKEKVYAAQVGCELCKGPRYTKDCPLKEEGKTLKEAYYTQFGVPFQQGGQYIAATLGFYQRNNANPSYQERRQSMEESPSKFMNESAKRHEENSNLIKEIRDSKDAAIRNQGASIKALEIQIGQMSKVLKERRSVILPSSTETNSRDHVNSISTTVETDTILICLIGSTRYSVSAQLNSKLIFEPRRATIPFPSRLYDVCYDEEKGSYGLKDLDAYSIRTTLCNDILPKKGKDPGSFTLPCYINNVYFEKSLTDLGVSVSVMPLSTYLNLGLGELGHTKLTIELVDRIVKHPKGIAKNVLVGIGTFVFPVDFIILDMPKDVNVPLILGRPFLSTTHSKVDVFKRNITLRVRDEKIIFKSVKPASSFIKRVYMLSLREKMDFDLEARLMGETLFLNRLFDPLYGDYIELNDLNEPLELKRNRVGDLKPIVEEGEVVDEPIMDIVKIRWNFIGVLDDYPSNCDFGRRIRID